MSHVLVKWIVHPKMKIVSLCTQHHVVTNLFDVIFFFFSFSVWKIKMYAKLQKKRKMNNHKCHDDWF